MPQTKCPTVRSGGTTSVRSALMPTLMISRASMDGAPHHNVVPANRRDPDRVMSHGRREANAFQTINAGGYGSPAFAGTTRVSYLFCIALRSTKVLPPFILWASGASLI